MTDLTDILRTHVAGSAGAPGAVALVAHGDQVEVAVHGSAEIEQGAPMQRDSLFRIASITKPITAVATMIVIEDGVFELDSPIAEWLPELADPMVVRTPGSALDDCVPARRPITVFDLLTFTAGYGFPADFSLPAVSPLFDDLGQGPPQPLSVAAPEEWMAILAATPMLHQPGDAWLYNTCSDILGVLIARSTGLRLDDFLAERIFQPLGMVDTGFVVPADRLHRMTSLYRRTDDGLQLVDPPNGQWSRRPDFFSGAGGLISTVDDWYAFATMLLADGRAPDGRQLIEAASVRQITSNQVSAAQRSGADVFLQGQGWGFGGAVDLTRTEPFTVPGRYGWVGGTGTSAYIVPSTTTATVVLTQLELTGPSAVEIMHDVWNYAAR